MIRKEELEDIFSVQLKYMDEELLISKVLDTWLAGCEAGGWNNTDELRDIPFTLLTDTRGISLIEHTIAVTEGARGLARAMEDTYDSMPYIINYDRLTAGGLLHDVGKLLEIEPDGAGGYRKSQSGRCKRHPISGAILAAEAGLSEEIINTIACHAKEGEGKPQVIETVLIHQADFACFNPLVMLDSGKLIT